MPKRKTKTAAAKSESGANVGYEAQLWQMADRFVRERSVITKHVRNVFREFDDDDLDVIISVGYRVESLRGAQFRSSATTTFREHLLRGYTLNERRLRERVLGEVEQAVGLLAPVQSVLEQAALLSGEWATA